MRKFKFKVEMLLEKEGSFDLVMFPTIIISYSNEINKKSFCFTFAFLFWDFKITNY